MHRKVVPMGKVLKYYFLTAAFVIAVLLVFPTLLRGIRFVTVPPLGLLNQKNTYISKPNPITPYKRKII